MPWPITFLVVEDEDGQYDGLIGVLRSVCAGLGLEERESGSMSFWVYRAQNQEEARSRLQAYESERPTLIIIFDIVIEPINPKDISMDRFIHQQLAEADTYLAQACVIIYSVIHRARFDSRLRDYLEHHPEAAHVVFRNDPREKFRRALRVCLTAKMAEADNG